MGELEGATVSLEREHRALKQHAAGLAQDLANSTPSSHVAMGPPGTSAAAGVAAILSHQRPPHSHLPYQHQQRHPTDDFSSPNSGGEQGGRGRAVADNGRAAGVSASLDFRATSPLDHSHRVPVEASSAALTVRSSFGGGGGGAGGLRGASIASSQTSAVPLSVQPSPTIRSPHQSFDQTSREATSHFNSQQQQQFQQQQQQPQKQQQAAPRARSLREIVNESSSWSSGEQGHAPGRHGPPLKSATPQPNNDWHQRPQHQQERGMDYQSSAAAAPPASPTPFATESTLTASVASLRPLEQALLELNLEKQALGSELDRLQPRKAGGRTLRDRQRMVEVERRLGDLDRDATHLRTQIRRATGPA